MSFQQTGEQRHKAAGLLIATRSFSFKMAEYYLILESLLYCIMILKGENDSGKNRLC